MKTVTINGKDYACPFADDYPPHSADEMRTLDESVAVDGVHDPIATYDSPTHGTAIWDGVTRAILAAKHEKTVPVKHYGNQTDAAAEKMLDDKHLGRRNLTPKKQEERRKERLERVASKRSDGKSLRVIADEEGVSLAQTRRDIEEVKSTVPPGTVEPEKVKGRDGKERPARQPRAPKAPAATKAKPSEEPDPEPTPPDDEPPAPEEDPADQFTATLSKLCYDLDAIGQRIVALKESKFAYAVHWQSARDQTKNARETLWGGRTNRECPYCKANGEIKPDCRCCRGTGSTTISSYKAGVAAVGTAGE